MVDVIERRLEHELLDLRARLAAEALDALLVLVVDLREIGREVLPLLEELVGTFLDAV